MYIVGGAARITDHVCKLVRAVCDYLGNRTNRLIL